jgi:hypothetical protein
MRIKVQRKAGRPEVVTLQETVIVNHPEDSASGTCRVCEPANLMPVEAAGSPPFHPNCVCTVEWVEASE